MPPPVWASGNDVIDATVVRQIVLKLHSQCNLSCDYCYVYHHVDKGWQRQPATMSAATLRLVGRRIGEHVRRHDLTDIAVVLHGGEPLLAGLEGVEAALATIEAAVPAGASVRFSVQTNGILLDEAFLDLFHRYRVRVGVSIDGDAQANDRHRRYRNGRGSYDRVAAALRLLGQPRHREIYGGLLCTVDVRNDPRSVHRVLTGFRPPSVDLLLPHGNWTYPPPRPVGAMSYADWLIAFFDAWYAARHEQPGVRLFESIISRILGGDSHTEAIGGDLPGVVVIETDGSYEQSDALKTTTDGGAATGLTAAAHDLDDVVRYLAVPAGLSAACQACPVASVCGGGLRAHRYRADNLFDNPSVYCPDLFRLINHVDRRVRSDLVRL